MCQIDLPDQECGTRQTEGDPAVEESAFDLRDGLPEGSTFRRKRATTPALAKPHSPDGPIWAATTGTTKVTG